MLKPQNIFIKLLTINDTEDVLQFELDNQEFFQTNTMKRPSE